MKIILAKSAGFCFGVKRAVDIAYDVQDTNGVFTLGPIIHNDHVVNGLKEKGIHPIETLANHTINQVIIRSHGVSKTVYNQAEDMAIQVVDATCPYVKKIHKLVERHYAKGETIIVIGNKNHPEVIGINGWAEDNCLLIKDQNDEQLNGLDSTKKYYIVAQTTYKKEVVDAVLARLDEMGIHYTFTNTICNATTERQQEAVNIASEVACMFVIGSSYSSNTQKLYELCKDRCENTYCIEDFTFINKDMLKKCNTIGVTAGASAPKDVINDVLKRIQELGEG